MPDLSALLEAHRAEQRVAWIDASAFTSWSGRSSLFAVLGDDDVSLTFDAAARIVWEHRAGRRRRIGTDIFSTLAAAIERDRDRPDVVWVGYLGYGCRTDLPVLGSSPGVPGGDPDRHVMPPDAVWMRTVDPVVVRHSDPRTAPAQRPCDVGASPPPQSYRDAFAEVQERLHAGDSYEVNLTYRIEETAAADPVDVYRRLREINPAPYAAYLRHDDVAVLSSSPERFARVTGRRIETRPIKGTTPRSSDPVEDAAAARLLSSAEKYRAENLMIVDLLRNDLSMMCEPGTVETPMLMEVESYATVHQLVSTVTGVLSDGVDTCEAIRRMFPPGSMTGAPKRRTMSVIADVESTPRGVYAGTLGWIAPDGDADLSVVIRTLTATRDPRGSRWHYAAGTGGGITVQSQLEDEWAESRVKADRLRSALGAC
ncbi:aminodeoxychorismate synthase component I [Nocardioides humi]|uniref:Chorismate-utilising enzyme C-terminal domain-containing protein n=1 Tax=Nocardioides humi TaxID=449461 RepID=A0ABN1ZYE3_9ACTN|nr:aminodeoxychorismate synthase component I [Nocardioides humi]